MTAAEEMGMEFIHAGEPADASAQPATASEETILKMASRITQLEMRLEDVAAMVAFLMPPVEDQPPPVDQVLAAHFGVCDHGRLLRDPCPHCQARTR